MMLKHIVKVERHGGQIRVTIPKWIVDKTGFGEAAYGLMWVTLDRAVLIRPFIDGDMLRETVSGYSVDGDSGS